MAKTQIGVRLPNDLLQAVDKLGEEELRDRTNTVEWILLRWFREHRPDLLDPKVSFDELKDAFGQAHKLPESPK